MKFFWTLLFSFFSLSALASCGHSKTQLEMTMCSAEELAKANSILNELDKSYLERLNDEQVVLYRNTQTAWLNYRDKSCEFESSGVSGGSAYHAVRNGCLLRATKVRIEKIKLLMNCVEGDLSCPRFL